MGDGTWDNPLTREDLLTRIEENGGKAEGLDLSWKVFENGIDLRELNLEGIILKVAVLWLSHLEGAILKKAHLEGAGLWDTHLEGANLLGAHLEGAYLWDAHLKGVTLSYSQFSTDTRLEGAHWGDYVLGEERSRQYQEAADSYRRLKQWYTNAGIYDTAGKFFYREKEANRKSLKLCSKDWNNRLAAEFMRALFGYGEDWRRILYWIAGVILGLAVVYYFWGSFTSASFWDTLYYSAVSFTALGYGQWAPQPTGWAKGMGVAEAIIGVFMMALLLVTFVRKWTR